MSTTTRAEASRLNGSKSHGPITETGKSRSSRNAVKHGLFAGLDAPLDPGEAEVSKDFLSALIGNYSPQTPEQLNLVMKIVKCECRLLKIGALESSIYAVQPSDEEDKNLFYSRLVTTLTKVTRIERSVLQTLRETKEQLQELKAGSLPEIASTPPSPKIEKFQNEPKPFRQNVPQPAPTPSSARLEIGYPSKLHKKLQKRTPALA
jgi:hypothetical protein